MKVSPSKRIRAFWQSFLDIVGDALTNFSENGQTNQAAAISLYAILSFIPLVILTFLLIGHLFGTHPEIKIHIVKNFQYLNPTASSALIDQLGILEEKQKVFGGLGFITLLWFSSMVFGAIEKAFNMVFPSDKPRSFIASKILAFSMIPLAWLLGSVSFALSSLTSFFEYLPPSLSSIAQSSLIRFAIPFAITILFAGFMYKMIPPISIPWRASLATAVIFASLLEPTKYLFPWYVTHYAKYNLIYGSLGTLIILIFWVFYISLIFLFCGEIMSSYLRRDIILLEKMFSRKSNNQAILDERVVKKFGRFFPKNTYVFREGDTGQDMYYVIRGRVQMAKESGPARKILGEMGAGNYFGEMAALIDAPRTASAYTIEDSTLAVIDRKTFRELLKKSDYVSLLMLQEFSRRLKYTSEALEKTARKTLTLFILLYLSYRWKREHSLSDLVINIATSTGREKREIEAVLSELETKGIIRQEAGRIVHFQGEEGLSFITWKNGA